MEQKIESWPIALVHRPRLTAVARGVHDRSITRYHLPELWCLHLYDYRGELLVNGQSVPLRPRHATVLAPGTHLEYRLGGPSVHLFAHFRLPPARATNLRIPLLENLGADFAGLYRDFERAIGVFARWPGRTEVLVWNILWTLVQRHAQKTQPAPRRHPAVDRVAELIEQRLHEPLYGEALARTVNLSHPHLIRLFRATLGVTPQAYIRQRRGERARQLLRHTTLPIKAVAAEVGIPDLHLFNKTIRQLLGHAPRQIRRQED